ncbi:hypothetical protein DICVIV_01166 [Dictyocaulus viviparus]|uniref:Exportin-1/Importin-beta-like domain-containing protein n=1 Tax=Dictyocaulus viviparus TaxID=29172 RepID=A0A0D8YD96_DICVI|nr:hypothetical protein DICVIV_01166 [Dictyocaulus viviparus]
MTFNIWYRISEGLFSFEDDQHIEKFKPYVIRYLDALYRHCRYDTEEEGIPDRDGDFADFRLKMHAMLMSCSQNGTWDETEAALFIISTVIGNIIPEENVVVPELVNAIIRLPSTSHPALLLTSIDLLGSASEWLSKNSSHLEKVVEWILHLAVIPSFAAPATEAIDKIVVRSSSELLHLIPLLVRLIPHLETSQCQGKKMEVAISSCLKACTTLIMNLPEAGISLRLSELAQPIIERLQLVISSTSVIITNNENEKAADSWARIAGEPVLWIDRIATIFREVRPWNGGNLKTVNSIASDAAPWLDIATKLYEVLSETLTRYESASRVVEHCCRSIRFIVRSLGLQSIGFVEPLITQMMDIFSRHQHSCFLYLSSILVDEYGSMESLQPGLMIMLESFAHGTFTVLTLENGPRDHPDTVDDLFRLAMRYCF